MTETSICFDQLNLVCADLEAAIAFYRLLGVAIPEQSLWGSETRPHHVSDIAFGPGSMDLDSTELADVYNAGHRTGGSVGGCVLGFRLSSRQAVDDLHKRMVDAGHPSRQEPYDTWWGARYAIVADPDGRDVGIMSPSEPDRRFAGPDLP